MMMAFVYGQRSSGNEQQMMMLGSCRRGDGPALWQRVRSMRGAVANRLRFTNTYGGPGSAAEQIPSLPSLAQSSSPHGQQDLFYRHGTCSWTSRRFLAGKMLTCVCVRVWGLSACFAAAKRYEVATIAHRNRRFDSAAHRCAAGRAVSLYAAPAAVPAGASPHCSLCTARIRACTACIRACTACIRVDGLHWSLHRCSQPQKLSTWC